MWKCTYDDPTLQAVIQMTRDDRWYEIGKYDGLSGIEYDELLIYCSVKEEITVNVSGNMVIKNNKLVFLRNQVFSSANEGHQGVLKVKSCLQSRVWSGEKEVKLCIPRQANTGRGTVEPLRMLDLPRDPWLILSEDFCGPLPSRDYLLVVVDEYSRFHVVEVVPHKQK